MDAKLKYAFEWLDQRHQSLQEVAKIVDSYETDFGRGYRKGIEFAAEKYEEELQRIRQLLQGYMVEDVNLDGMEDELHESA